MENFVNKVLTSNFGDWVPLVYLAEDLSVLEPVLREKGWVVEQNAGLQESAAVSIEAVYPLRIPRLVCDLKNAPARLRVMPSSTNRETGGTQARGPGTAETRTRWNRRLVLPFAAQPVSFILLTDHPLTNNV